MTSLLSFLFVLLLFFFFFFNDPAPNEIYTLSLHDALPILSSSWVSTKIRATSDRNVVWPRVVSSRNRSEEHTSELQSPMYLVCRLLLEKKKNKCKTFKTVINKKDQDLALLDTYYSICC